MSRLYRKRIHSGCLALVPAMSRYCLCHGSVGSLSLLVMSQCCFSLVSLLWRCLGLVLVLCMFGLDDVSVCFGHVLAMSRSCLGVVSVMSRLCFGYVSVVSRSFLGLVFTLSQWCLGPFSVLSLFCLMSP